MNLFQRFNTAACVAVFLAIIAYCAAEESAVMGLVALPATLAGWYTVRRGGRHRRSFMLPKGMVNLLVLLAVIHAGAQATIFRTENTLLVSDLTQFLVHIQLVKLFDRRTHRDDAQLLGLSMFIVIGAMLTSNAFLLGLVLAAYTPVAVIAAMLLQITAGMSRPSEEAQPKDASPATRAERKRRRRIVKHVRRIAVTSVAMSCVMAAVVFVLTPRNLGQRFFGRFGVAGGGSGSSVGFNDSISLGRSSGRLSASEEIVMDVTVLDAKNEPVGETGGPLYLRGSTLDVYRGNGVWDRNYDRFKRVQHELTANTPQVIVALRGQDLPPDTVHQRITIRNAAGDGRGGTYLFGMWRPAVIVMERNLSIRIAPEDSSMRCFEQRRQSGEDGQGGWRGEPLTGRLTYEVFSFNDQADTPLVIPAPSERQQSQNEERRRWRSDHEVIAEPGVDLSTTRIGELARQVVGEAFSGARVDLGNNGTVHMVALAIRDHLRSRCTYSLDLKPTRQGDDPIENFLFHTQQGHCEYFASAMAAMCQSVGVSARVVTGYLVSEYDAFQHQYIVRERDAHAWVEVGMPDGRWVVFDPTPAGAIEDLRQPDTGAMATVREWYEKMELGWAKSIIGFDASSQAGLWKTLAGDSEENGEETGGSKGLLGTISTKTSAVAAWFQKLMPPELRERWHDGVAAWAALMFAGVAMFTAGILWLVRIQREKTVGHGKRRAVMDKELRRLLAGPGGSKLSRRLNRAFRRAGLARPSHRSLAAHAEVLGGASGGHGLTGDLARLAAWYERVRFGRTPLTAEEAEQAQSLLATVEARLGNRPR